MRGQYPSLVTGDICQALSSTQYLARALLGEKFCQTFLVTLHFTRIGMIKMGHVITLDQWEASILVTWSLWTNEKPVMIKMGLGVCSALDGTYFHNGFQRYSLHANFVLLQNINTKLWTHICINFRMCMKYCASIGTEKKYLQEFEKLLLCNKMHI